MNTETKGTPLNTIESDRILRSAALYGALAAFVSAGVVWVALGSSYALVSLIVALVAIPVGSSLASDRRRHHTRDGGGGD